jgi:hypothetical protein
MKRAGRDAAPFPPRTPDKRKPIAVKPKKILRDRLGETGKTRIVEIVWDDAVSVGGSDWEDENSVSLKAAPSVSIGYLVAESDEAITVVALANDTHYAHGITIPQGMVVEIRDLT